MLVSVIGDFWSKSVMNAFMCMVILNRHVKKWFSITLNVPLMDCSLVELMSFTNLFWLYMGSMFAMSAKIRMWSLYNALWKMRNHSSFLVPKFSITYGARMIMRSNMMSIALWHRCQQHNPCDQCDLFETEIKNNTQKFWQVIYLPANLQCT